MMKHLVCILILSSQWCLAQPRQVAVTIDDVPNVNVFQRDKFRSILLERIEKLNIPVAIFINEKNIYNTAFVEENIACLKRWLTSNIVTPGNHSFSHINYADTTLESFQQDIIKGEKLTAEIIRRRPPYFRFPFNSLGNDSTSYAAIQNFLTIQGYIHAPFTIESEDWAFNALYEDALQNRDADRAREIGQQYVIHTMNLFHHFETLCKNLFGRNIRHIYLCHDNQLNRDYLPALITELDKSGYSFISLEQALDDIVYQSTEYYIGRYGFSWIYRWEKDQDKRKAIMRGEPVDESLHVEYQRLVNKK
jgi:peptidoglycan/xylan/chitin deacetylase (PgdA/CDA1 family)